MYRFSGVASLFPSLLRDVLAFNSLCLVYTSRETQLTERKGVKKRWKEGGEDGQRDRDREGREKEGEREKSILDE